MVEVGGAVGGGEMADVQGSRAQVTRPGGFRRDGSRTKRPRAALAAFAACEQEALPGP